MTAVANSPARTSAELATALALHPIVAEVLWRRGHRSIAAAEAFLDPDRYTPASPLELPDMERAVGRLSRAIAGGERIRIWGDFDVDGQTATSVLLLGLERLGARVDFEIPDRATHSHGLNREGIERAAADGIAMLLTCDCGIAEFDEIAHARALGLDIIVSDHHDLHVSASGEPRLPDATAIVNPKRLPASHALATLPGVGVAFKLIEALSAELPAAARIDDALDLVALGIVADVALQIGDTRYLLQQGLAKMRTAPRPGIRALMTLAGIEPRQMSADDIGFQIGPRLNAAGRLATAALAVQLLTTDDPDHARELATRIDQLNGDRRELQKRIEAEAFALIAAEPALTDAPVIVLHKTGWNPSVIGIVASSIVDRYRKPTIMIAEQPDESPGRASARSVDGVDIHAAIESQHTTIEGGGGHPMAAGFAIRRVNIAAFATGIKRWMAEHPTAGATARRDSAESFVLAWRDAGLPLAEQLERLAPFGAGNPRPLLSSKPLTLARHEMLGKDNKHRAVFLDDGAGHIGRAVWWRAGALTPPEPDVALQAFFFLKRDVFRGAARAQIEIDALTPIDEFDPIAVDHNAAHTVTRAYVDLRANLPGPDADAALAEWLSARPSERMITWRATTPLSRCEVLVLRDAPPGPDEFARIVAACQPATIVLLPGADHDDIDAIYRDALALIRTAQRRGDSLDDPDVQMRMALRVNQRAAMIRACVARFRGDPDAGDAMRHALAETRGYRRFLRTTGVPK